MNKRGSLKEVSSIVTDVALIVGGGVITGLLLLGALLSLYQTVVWFQEHSASRVVLDLREWHCTDYEPGATCYEYRLDHTHAMSGSAKR